MRRLIPLFLMLAAVCAARPLPARDGPLDDYCWRQPAQLFQLGDFAWFVAGCSGGAGPDVGAVTAEFEAAIAPPPESADAERTRLVTVFECAGQPRGVTTVRGQDEPRFKFERRHRRAVRDLRR